ncbi:MAG: DUF423 domain-containing protein [Candidatus Caenarcaniphilales bacterium]|nr:DUF423 domain-containing protein [Candidatus Caenarcaniphilales bacterium]
MLNWTFLGSILCFLSVSLGAFGAHGLKSHLSEGNLAVFHTGVTYQFMHSLSIIILGICIVSGIFNKSLLRYSCICFLAGIVLFSGSLYILSTMQIKWIGFLTPLGGLLFLIGWILFGLSTLNK